MERTKKIASMSFEEQRKYLESEKSANRKDGGDVALQRGVSCGEPVTKCELRPGIGLCDACGLPKWPQKYEGYGSMICLDCIEAERKAANAAELRHD
ncbi:MAG: hypothetical protein KGL39_34050 [Patescibacteria group bacterium]|nr:hypothetical protein [Patescibacteria group bacterium]